MSHSLIDTPPIRVDKNQLEKWFARIIWLSALATIATYWVGQIATKQTVDLNEKTINTHTIMIADQEKRIIKLEDRSEKLMDILNKIDTRTARIEGKLENF